MKKFIFYGYVKESNDISKKFVNDNGNQFIGYVDSNKNKQDILNEIYPPSFIGDHQDAVIVIMSDKIKEISEFIHANGWKNEIMVFPHLMNPYIVDDVDREEWMLRHKKTIYDIYENDYETQRILTEMFNQRTMKTFNFIDLDKVIDLSHENLYFYDESLAPKTPFTLINGGVYWRLDRTDASKIWFSDETRLFI